MKLFLLAALSLVALAAARPDSVLNLDLDGIHHDQDLEDGEVVSGTYSWTSPEGEEFFVRYVADENGYRVLESNAVPASEGVAADGQQGSFVSFEEEDN
ncbi:cuticular protein 47Eg-like [Palaemon carinicauda]|uniref:cuticular protein 47Eg-like n=1 Tax=Palaemon carinicauda TaxID=392227 RepID=UPI0035B60D51